VPSERKLASAISLLLRPDSRRIHRLGAPVQALSTVNGADSSRLETRTQNAGLRKQCGELIKRRRGREASRIERSASP
jgi:hypothetical protein